VAIGKAWGHPIYGWDNEYGRHRAQVPPFRASRHLVSNGEFLEFVEDGGYGEERWWTGEGWRWRTWRGVEHPLFWRRREGGSWALRLLAEEIGMPWNWPVEVNQLEAKAFCNWLGARRGEKIRLPGEDEWRLLRERNLDTDQPWWEKAPGNINLEHWASSCPVDRFRQGEFYDLIGNVWQWTETPIYPFEGFRVHPIYDDFSTPTFDDRHNLILGGSWISTGNEATADARYAFRRHFHQHAGFRYVAAEEEAPTYGDPYITERDVTRSCDAHWGMERLGLDNFYRRLAELCAELDAPPAGGSALHINCGTGRLAFELARRAGRVLGLDLSARFIRVPVQLRARGQVHHTLVREGEIDTFHEIRLADLELADAVERVEFFQDNAANLQAKWGSFDLVAATDLLDHMADPRRFLEAVHRFVNPGGLLLLACPWQWEGERTPREKWLGGYKDATGDNQEDREVIGHLLSPHFTPAGEPCTLRRVLHENGRRLTVLDEEVTFWRRSS